MRKNDDNFIDRIKDNLFYQQKTEPVQNDDTESEERTPEEPDTPSDTTDLGILDGIEEAPEEKKVELNINISDKAKVAIGAAVLAAAIIGLSAYDMAHRPEKPNPVVAFDENPTGADMIEESIDADMLPFYQHLLVGDYYALLPEGTDEKLFSFHDDGTYAGYSSREDYDAGTYELYMELGNPYVKVICEGSEDVYRMEIDDNGNIILYPGGNFKIVLDHGYGQPTQKTDADGNPIAEESAAESSEQ